MDAGLYSAVQTGEILFKNWDFIAWDEPRSY